MFDGLRSHGRGRSLLSYLVALVLLVLLPSLALGGITLAKLAATYQRGFERQLDAVARSVAATLDQTLELHLALARSLASSDHLRHGDVPAFEAQARAAGEALGTWISLTLPGPDYRRLVNTALPPGSQPDYGGLVLPPEQAPIPRVFATGEPAVTNVGQSIALNRPTALILAPVTRGGAVTHVVALGFEPSRVARILGAQDLSAPFTAIVVDGRRRIVAASTDHDRLAGQPAPDWAVAGASVDGHRPVRREPGPGGEVLASVIPLRNADWLTVVSVPARAANEATMRSVLLLGVGGFLWLAVATASAAALARRVSRPIGQLATAVSEPGTRSLALRSMAPTGVAEVEVLREALFAAAAATEEQRRREREDAARLRLLTAELSHRVKNALSVVLAALHLTPKHDQAAYVRAVEGRVSALARANTSLADSNWGAGDLRTLIEGELAAFRARDAGPRVALQGPAVPLPAMVVQPLAIVIHELATNAVKHGALSIPEGRLRICWSLEPSGDLIVRWEESNGRSEPPTRRGFGSRILDETIRRQLRGEIEREWGADGLRVTARLPSSSLASSSSEAVS